MDENTITTVFRADISQFSASTQELNRYIKTVNSEFDVATAGMGKWSDTTDGLTAKITQLNKVLQAEKMKLDDMRKRYDELKKAGKENSKEAQNLAININKQTATVKDAEGQIKHYEQSLKDLGDTSSSVGGKIAKGLGGVLAGIGATAVGAVGGFLALGESTREYRQGLNQLETAFGRVGFSAEDTYNAFNYFGSVLGDTRKAQETMLVLGQLVESEKELESWTDTLTGVFATYGEAIPLESMSEAIVLASKQAVAEGGLADALEWGGVNLENFNKKLESLNSEEERSAYIQDTLNGLYGEAAEQYKELNKDVLEASTAQTNLEHAMAKLGAVAEPIMTMLKNAIADLLMALEPAVKLMGEGLKGAFEGSADGAKKFADGLTGIVNTLLGKITEALPKIVDVAIELIPSLINAILGAIPNLVSTLLTVVSKIVGALGKMIPSIIQKIIEVIPQLVESIVNALPLILEGITQLVLGIVQALPSLIENLVSALPVIINTIIDGLISFIPQLIDASITLLMAIVDAIPVIIEALIPQIPKIVNSVIDGLLNMLPVLLDGAVKLLTAIIDAIPILIQKLIPQIPKIVTTIIKTLTSRIGDLINGALQLFMGIVDAIPLLIQKLIPQIPTIIKSIVSGLIEGLPDMIKAGADLLGGLVKGLLNPEAIWNAVKSLGKSILSGIKSFFGIKSPSRVFKDQIGKNLALGIGEGFDDEIGAVTKDMQKHMKTITPALQVDTSVVGSNGWVNQLADLIGSRESKVVNNYKFDYKFEKMETSKIALHKAQLETKRVIGG